MPSEYLSNIFQIISSRSGYFLRDSFSHEEETLILKSCTFNRPAASSADPKKHCSLVPGTDHRAGDVNRISNAPFLSRSGPKTLSEDPPEVSRYPRGSHQHSRRTPRGPRASKRDACAVNQALRVELEYSLPPSAPPP